MPDPLADTAAQRPPTGLDEGARELILRIVGGTAGLDGQKVVGAFFMDRYGGFDDYFAAVESVWGESVSYRLRQAASQAAAEADIGFELMSRREPDAAAARALLLRMPEPDFRLAVTDALRYANRMEDAAERITQVCRNRGAPWAFSPTDGFEYTGEENVERDLTRPALAAVNRAEFSGGVRTHYNSARDELAVGKPTALSQALVEAGSAVESAMKVVLDARGVPYGKRDAAKKLFEALATANIVDRDMENLVLVAMTPRNKRGGHGAGAQAHAVSPEEAQAVVAGAGGAIAYLATLLP